jgi:hypothetical protein
LLRPFAGAGQIGDQSARAKGCDSFGAMEIRKPVTLHAIPVDEWDKALRKVGM